MHEPGHDRVVGIEGGEPLALGDRLHPPAHDRQALCEPAAGPQQALRLNDVSQFAHVPLDHIVPERPFAGCDAEAILLLRGMHVGGQLRQEHVGEGTVWRDHERLGGSLSSLLGLKSLRRPHERFGLGERLVFLGRPASAPDRDPLFPCGQHFGEHAEEDVSLGWLVCWRRSHRPPWRRRSSLSAAIPAAGWFLGVAAGHCFGSVANRQRAEKPLPHGAPPRSRRAQQVSGEGSAAIFSADVCNATRR